MSIENNHRKRIAIVGLGYVGLPLAILADQKNYMVIGIDTDPDKVIAVKIASGLSATKDFSNISSVSIIIVCVPTPVDDNHQPDLSILLGACEQIGQHLQKGQLVIIESTVNPGVCESIVSAALERESGLKKVIDFHVAHCPERVNPGDKEWNVENIPRVIGSTDEAGLGMATEFYRSVLASGVNIRPMDTIQEAEAVKVVENSFRDINIAFANELAMSFDQLGINVVNVMNGAATKPFAFIPHYPGCGVGGHCIPVDPYYLIEHAMTKGFHHDFLALARRINDNMPVYCANKAIAALKELKIPIKGTKVAVLGLSYKPNIGDVRESPANKVIETLKGKGVQVETYDPHVKENSTASTLKQAIQGAKSIILVTAHAEFLRMEPKEVAIGGVKILIDGRNCLDRLAYIAAGVAYKGIGV